MCELLGFSSRKKRRRNDLLREFYSHAEAHPHGWGLARFPDGGAPLVEKEPVSLRGNGGEGERRVPRRGADGARCRCGERGGADRGKGRGAALHSSCPILSRFVSR